MTKIGTITIGQSPREDIIPEMKKILGSAIVIVESGALDGFSLQDVQQFAPSDDDHVVVSRMRDGTAVTLAKKHVTFRLQHCIHRLEKKGVDLIALLGTAIFPELISTKLIIRPGNLLQQIVTALIETGTIGVVTPLKAQRAQTRIKWERLKVNVVVDYALPYATEDQVLAVARRLAKANVDLIVLDCIGFNLAMKRRIRAITEKPTLLPITLLARTIAELVTS
jgi:protein AroM